MSYNVKFGTGAGDETGIETLEAAKEYADKQASYTKCSIIITDDNDDEVCSRKWWGVQFDESVDPSEDQILFGDFGYYADWEGA